MIDAQDVPEGNAEGATGPADAPRTAARGNRFAKDRAPSRDAAGRSLPSDKDLDCVALHLVCRCHPRGEEPVLARFEIASQAPTFERSQVVEGRNSAVIGRTSRTDVYGHTYVHYEMRCPKCRATPRLTQETVDQALAAIYEQGARSKVVRHRV